MRAEPTVPTPLDPDSAAQAIEAANDRQQVFDLLLRAARSRLHYAALLSVHPDHIRGRSALAVEGIDCSGVDTLRIPRNSVAAFEEAIASGSPSVSPLATGEPFIDGYLELLGGGSSAALLMPIVINARTIALVAAHRGNADLTLDEVADLFPLIPASSRALARVLAVRSNATRSSRPVMTTIRNETEGYEIEVSMADVNAKRGQLVVYRRNQQWEELADGIRDLVRDGMEFGDPDEDEQLDLLLELGRVEAEQLASPDRAVEAYRSALTIDASDSRVLDALESLFVQQGQWEECVELVEKRVILADGTLPRIAALLNLAALAHDKLGDEDRAIEAYERILAIEPGHEIASRELEQLYEYRERWEKLIALLLDRASRHKEPQERIAALMTVANLYEGKTNDAEAAFIVWLTVFRREPERPHLLEQLDRLVKSVPDCSDFVAETSKLAQELEAKHPSIAAELWQHIAMWLRDRLGNREEAVRAFDRAAQLDPSAAARDEAAELLRNDGRWPELVQLLARRAEAETDARRKSEAFEEIASIYEDQLGQPGEALAWYERAVNTDPESGSALVALHRLYLEDQAWDALGELLPRLIEVIGPSTPRSVIVDLDVELGTILAEHLHRPEDAVEAFRDALALDNKHVAAYEGIEKIYEASGQTEALLETREAQVDALGGMDQARRYADIASLWHDFNRLDRAATCWQKVIAIEPKNLDAHKGLARALRDDEQWATLAEALRTQLRLINEPFERIALLLEQADLFENQFDNVDGAIAAYRDVLALDAHNSAALRALGRLYDRAGNWQPALEMMQRLLEETTDKKERGDLLQRIGQVQLNTRDAVKAEASLAEAISLDPNNAGAHEGMGRVLLLQGKLVGAGEELLKAAQLSQSQSDTLRLLAEAAWLYRYRLDDNEQARGILQRILEIDPDNADAKKALSELLHDNQEWEALWPHLQEQAERAKADLGMPPEERLAIFSKAARCAVELGKYPAAIVFYDAASELDKTPATQLDRAEALFRSRNIDASATAYQTLVARFSGQLERPQMVNVYRKLGTIHAELGKVPQAVTYYQKVLDLDPTQRDTLEELTELHLSRGQFDDAIGNLRALAGHAPVEERVLLLERIGDLYRDKLSTPGRAMSTYLDALELDKHNHRILQRVLDLQSEQGQWKSAVETIEQFLEIEKDKARRGAYLLAAAEIRRIHLMNDAGALEYYEMALDEMLSEDPLRPATRERALDAFHALRKLVTSEQNWKYLEQSYRRMIKRLPKQDPVLLPLWDGLGDIYRSKLEHYQSAIEAYEVAHALDPDKSAHRGRALAELYALTGAKRPEQTTERAAKLVEVDPMNADAYRALGRASLEAGRVDEAWCVARALVFLKQANSQETALYRKYQSLETRKAKGILDEDAWAYVRHADEDRTISGIFALVWEGPVALRAGPTKAFELKPKERLAIEEGTGVVAKIFKHASRVLNIALPDVYVQPRRSGRLLLANCVEKGRLAPAVIVGRDLMTGYRDTEIAASVGAMLALLRPTYYLKLTLFTLEELEAALVAATQLVGKKRPAKPQIDALAAQFATEMQKVLTRQSAEGLMQLVARLPEQVDLARWRNSVDAAAQRAGLLIAGDLAAAARMVASDPTPPGALRPNQRVQELVAYSVSPAYFTARRHLNVAVE